MPRGRRAFAYVPDPDEEAEEDWNEEGPDEDDEEYQPVRRARKSTRSGDSQSGDDWTLEYARSLTDQRSYQAGQQYFTGGAVRRLEIREGEITASVRGSNTYDVVLTAENRRLDFSCSCPWHEDTEAFCKHCVAVVLAYQKAIESGAAASPKDDKARIPTIEDLSKWLRDQGTDAVVALLLERAKEDRELRDRLFLRMAVRGQKDANRPELTRMIDTLTAVPDYLDYRETRDFARRGGEIVHALSELLETGEMALVRELALYAVERFTAVMGRVDDSNGHVGGLISNLIDIHLKVCVRERPDPKELARELLEKELSDTVEAWYGAASRYAEALGDAGRAEMRRLLLAEWEGKAKGTAPTRRTQYDSRDWRISRMLEEIAREEKDVDLTVRILSVDLSSAYDYQRIAEVCRDAKRYDEALSWAERGKAAFPNDYDRFLGDFLIEEYKRRKLYDKATEILWQRFERHESLEAYKQLYGFVKSQGQWPEWRQKALERIRERIDQSKSIKQDKGAANRYSGGVLGKGDRCGLEGRGHGRVFGGALDCAGRGGREDPPRGSAGRLPPPVADDDRASKRIIHGTGWNHRAGGAYPQGAGA